RGTTLPQPEDGPEPRLQPVRQAGGVEPGSGDRLREGPGIRSVVGREPLAALVEPEEVPCRIAQDGEGVTGAERHARWHGLDAELTNLLERAIDVLDHDVGKHSRLARGGPAEDPGAAHRAGRVVECAGPVTADPERPAEELHVERRGDLDVGRRDLEVTDLPRLHRRLLPLTWCSAGGESWAPASSTASATRSDGLSSDHASGVGRRA